MEIYRVFIQDFLSLFLKYAIKLWKNDSKFQRKIGKYPIHFTEKKHLSLYFCFSSFTDFFYIVWQSLVYIVFIHVLNFIFRFLVYMFILNI